MSVFRKILVISIGVALAATMICSCSSKKLDAEYDELIDQAEEYLEDENYKKAVSSYEDAIDLCPDREEAYLGLAEAYIEQGDLTSALSILKKGKRSVEDNDKIVDMMDDISSGKYDVEETEVTEPLETDPAVAPIAEPVETFPAATATPTPEPEPQYDEAAAASAYLDVLDEYEDEILAFENGAIYSMAVPGVSYNDITGDGNPELIFVYSTDDYDGYVIFSSISIYTYDPASDSAVCMMDISGAYMNAGGGFGTDIFLSDDGHIIMFADGGDEDWDTYIDEYVVDGNTLTLVKSYHLAEYLDESNGEYNMVSTYYLDDAEITEEEYEDAREEYIANLDNVVMIDPAYYYDWMYEYESDWLDMINSMSNQISFFDDVYAALSE